MKKAIIVIAVFLLFGLTMGLINSQIIYSPAPISRAKRDQLDADFAKVFTEYVPDWCTEDNIYGDCRILGEENGYIFFFYWGGMRPQAIETKAIGGVEFSHMMYFSFYVYKDGEFISVEKAYEQGLISREGLVAAQKYHLDATARYAEGRQKELEEYEKAHKKY